MVTDRSFDDIIDLILDELSGSSSTGLAEVATSIVGKKVTYDNETETFTIHD